MVLNKANFSDAKMTEERAKHLAELVAKVSYHNFRNNENIKIEMSKTSDKISS